MKAILPVSAVAFLNGTEQEVAMGVGRYLEIRDIRTGDLIRVQEALSKGSIHGILSDDNGHLVVFGGRELSIIDLKGGDMERRCFIDRIISVHNIKGELTLILAHGQVMILDDESQISREHVLSDDYLIYCATAFRWKNSLFVAFGTVFDGIEVLRVDPKSSLLHKECQIKGHEGSIFGISWNSTDHSLYSVSDDRTLRKWTLSLDNDKVSYDNRWIAVGHKSRVWRVVSSDSLNIIATSAEDGSIRLWDSVTGDLVRTQAGHIGLNIWSLAINQQWVLSGGDDCSVRLSPVNCTEDQLPRLLDFSSSVEPKCFEILPNGDIVTLLADGSVHEYDCHIDPNALGRHAVIRMINGALIAGTLTGHIFVQFQNKSVISVDCGFTTRVAYLNAWKCQEEGNLTLYVLAQAGNGYINLMAFQKGICLSHKPVDLDSTIICSSTLLPSGQILIGSRDGRVIRINADGTEIMDLGKIAPEAVSCIISRDDGREILITDRSGHLRVVNKWQRKITKGWLEQVCLLPDGRILLAGFEGINFFLKDLHSGDDLIRVASGGAHRFWSLRVLEGGKEVVFGFIRSGKVYTIRRSTIMSMGRIIKSPMHGAEIRTLARINSSTLISGGEDGRLIVFKDDLCILESVVAHKSGIKCITMMPTGEIICGGSGEELSAWKWMDAHLVRMSTASPVSKCKEVRIMDCHVIGHFVAVAYSDSYLRIWSYNEDNGFIFKSEYEAHPGHCTLRLASQGGNTVFSGGTDGSICKFKVNDDGSLECLSGPRKIHQSGINAMYSTKAGQILSGGDDGMLVISKSNEVELTIPSLHHSTITSVLLIDGCIITCSIDQRVKVLDESGQLIRILPIMVADPAACIQISPTTILVAGAGIEAIEV